MSRQIINDSSPSETSGQAGTSTINQIENEQTLQEVNTETLTSGQVGTSTISQVEDERDFFNSSDTYEKEFVTNGDFNTDISGWIEQRGGIEWDNGKLKVTHDNPEANTFTQRTDNGSITSGKTYQFSFDYKISGVSFVSANIRVNNVSQTTSPSLSEAGTATYKAIFTATQTGNLDIRLFVSGTPSSSEFATFDNVSIKEVVPFDDTSGQVGAFTINQIEDERDFFNDSDTYEKELVENGDFSDETNGWSAQRSSLSVVDGKLKILATEAFSFARQNITVISGKEYKITANFFYNSLEGNIEAYDGTTNIISERLSADGVIKLYVTPNSTNLRLTLLNRDGVAGDFNYWDNISVKEVVPFDDTSGQVGASTISQVEDERDFFNDSDTYEKELVTNGDFSNGDFGWTLNNGATVENGKGYIAGDGSSFTNIFQSGVFTSGKQYKVTVDVIINSGLGLKFQDGANNENIGFATTSGTYTFYFTATSNTDLIIGRRTGGTAFDSYVDNVSIKEVVPFDDTSGQVGTSTITQTEEERDFFNDSDTYEKELVTNGDFDTDSDWTKGSGWSISGGVASFNTTSNENIYQSGYANNKTYKVSIDVVSYVRGAPFIAIGQGSQFPVPKSTGTHIIYVTSGSADTILRIYGGQFGDGGDATIDNISVKEVVPFDDTSGQAGASTISQIENERIVTS